MWFKTLEDLSVCGVPLLVILLCGLAGVLVDLDHPIAHYLLPKLHERFLHTPILIICGLGLLYLCTYLGGLLLEVVLG